MSEAGILDVPQPEVAERFLDELYGSLSAGAGDAPGMARRAVSLFGRIENSPSGSLYFEYPVFRALDLDLLRTRLAPRWLVVMSSTVLRLRIRRPSSVPPFSSICRNRA